MGTVTNGLGRLFLTFIMTSVLLLITFLPKMELKKANYEKIKGSLYTASLSKVKEEFPEVKEVYSQVLRMFVSGQTFQVFSVV
ncbi:hypothetical protein [Aeribacillus alveayuensis]|uniref:hypothetical protein n=1 Tax=Aeribacillus alveayuensis TaxID=279215 RepID=UPI003AF2C674